METEEKFTRLCSELMDKPVIEHKTFKAMCRQLHTDEMLMDNLFYEKFGMSGEEVFYKFLFNSIVNAV